jgi:hypothetical protein
VEPTAVRTRVRARLVIMWCCSFEAGSMLACCGFVV